MMLFDSSNNTPWLTAAVITVLALGLVLSKASNATADAASPLRPSAILRPTALVLNVHRDIADTRFVAELVRRLRSRLTPPVVTQPVAFNLSALRGFGKLDAQRLIGGLVTDINWNQNRGVIHIFLIKDDMRLAPARYNYAVSVGTERTSYHVIVVSLARLQETKLFDSQIDANPARTAVRTFKMIAKNTAKIVGYTGGKQCLFSFPRNLVELDVMPEGFCEPDISLLNTAGVARPLSH